MTGLYSLDEVHIWWDCADLTDHVPKLFTHIIMYPTPISLQLLKLKVNHALKVILTRGSTLVILSPLLQLIEQCW